MKNIGICGAWFLPQKWLIRQMIKYRVCSVYYCFKDNIIFLKELFDMLSGVIIADLYYSFPNQQRKWWKMWGLCKTPMMPRGTVLYGSLWCCTRERVDNYLMCIQITVSKKWYVYTSHCNLGALKHPHINLPKITCGDWSIH